MRTLGSTNCVAIWTAAGAPQGSKRERHSRFESIPLSAVNLFIETTRAFLCLAERRGLMRTLGSTNCAAIWTAAGAPQGSNQGTDARASLIHSELRLEAVIGCVQGSVPGATNY